MCHARNRAELRIVPHDQPIDMPTLQQADRHRQHRAQIGAHQHPRAGITQLVHQLPLGIERREMRHHQPRTERAEKTERMTRRIRQIQRDPLARTQPERDQPFRNLIDRDTELGKTDLMAAILQRRLGPMPRDRVRQHRRNRLARNLDIPRQTLRIIPLPGERPRTHAAAALAPLPKSANPLP